ncbi:MAG: transporter substrate-binding domain-containing protein [Thermodesulfobacteriota bacterium]
MKHSLLGTGFLLLCLLLPVSPPAGAEPQTTLDSPPGNDSGRRDLSRGKQSSFAITPAEQAWIDRHPVIRSSSEQDWEPFDFRIGDQPAGYSVDLLNLLASRIGIRVEYVGGHTWNEFLGLFYNREIDVLHSLAKTPQREKHGWFTIPYLHNRLAFITVKGRPPLEGFEELRGKTFALIEGWWFEDYLTQNKPEIKILRVKTLEEALNAVNNEQAYATADFEIPARRKIEKLGFQNLVLSARPVAYTKDNPAALHILVRKDWPELRELLDKAFLSLGPDEIRDLQEKWFGDQPLLPLLSLTEEEKVFISNHPVLRVGFRHDNFPVSFTSNQRAMDGIAADYLSRVSNLLGFRYSPSPPKPWKDMLGDIQNNRLDLIAAITATENRRKWMDFTTAYISFPVVIVTHEDGPYIGDLQALKGHRVAVTEEDAAHHLLAAHHPDIPLLLAADVKAGLSAVEADEAYAYIGNLAAVSYVMGREGFTDLKISGETPYKLEITMGVPKGQTVLLNILEKSLAVIPTSEREAIHAKWFRVTYEHKVDTTLVWAILAAAFLGISAVLYWNRRLRFMAGALKKSEDNYRSIFDTANDAIFIHDTRSGLIVNVNAKMLEMYGFDRKEEVLGAPLASFSANASPFIRKEAAEWLEKAVHGEPQLFEWHARDKKGRLFWVEINLKKVTIGGVDYVLAIARDISERKKARDRLTQSEKRLAETQRIAQLGSWEFNITTREITYSEEALRIMGRQPGTIRTLDDYLRLVHPEDIPVLKQTIRTSGDENRPFEIEIRHLKADGSCNYTLVRGEPLIKDNQAVHFIGSLLDITERKHHEAELRRTKETAEAASRAKSVFLANMSHELRTPLNAILGFSELMTRDPNLTPGQRANLATIGRSGEYLLSLINDILELSKIEAGQVQLQQKSTDLHRLIDDMKDMFLLRARQKGLALQVNRSADVPRRVVTDPGKLRQILINLLGNAVKFTHTGGITLGVSVSGDNGNTIPGNSRTIAFEISDTGIGIPKDEQPKVFEAFYQTEGGRFSHQGTGLGLTISLKFIHMMGSDLTLRSAEGQGTSFRFDIRVEKADDPDTPAPASRQRVTKLAPDQPEIRILIVEDDDAGRDLLHQLLAQTGFQVKTAMNGEEGVALWEQWRPHLIWMDIRMPVMDGLTAVRSIRSFPGGRETRIIALTASAFEENRMTVLELGCDDFVTKPFREDDIFEILERHLDVRFVYTEDIPETFGTRDGIRSRDFTAGIAALPEDIRGELKSAVDALDFDRAMQVANHIGETDRILSDELIRLLNAYRFDTLRQLFPSGITFRMEETPP